MYTNPGKETMPLQKCPYSFGQDFSFWISAREDKGDRKGIRHTHPIPQVIRLELFLESG